MSPKSYDPNTTFWLKLHHRLLQFDDIHKKLDKIDYFAETT